MLNFNSITLLLGSDLDFFVAITATTWKDENAN
jgi:hypothetical protein